MENLFLFGNALNRKKLEIKLFLFSLKQMKGGKEKQDKTKNYLWPTADHRDSLKTPNRLINKLTDSPKTLSELNTRNL
jgi:hypothetical protein